MFSALLLLLVLPTERANGEQLPPWWDEAWPCRRVFRILRTPPNLQVTNAVAVEFLTGGRVQPDGRDVRVVGPEGQEVRSRVLRVEPEGVTAVAFEVLQPGGLYAVYYGHPQAPPRSEENWLPRGGILLETRLRPPGPCRNLQDFRALLGASEERFGLGFREQIADPYNPFGPSDYYLSLYHAYLYCPEDGEYSFAISSDDSSFLLLDGEQVVAWAGEHPYVADARHHGEVTLQRGVHELWYLHEEREVEQLAYAAWKKPSATAYATITAADCLRLLKAEQVAYEKQGQRVAADFTVTKVIPLQFGEWRVNYVRLRSRSTGPGPVACRWDFGDGVTAEGEIGQHLFLTTGEQRITLFAAANGYQDRVSQRLNLPPEEWPHPQSEWTLRYLFPLCSEYPLSALEEEALWNLWQVALALEQKSFAFLCGRAYLARFGTLAKAAAYLAFAELCREEEIQRPQTAAETYQQLLALGATGATARTAQLNLAEVYFRDLDDAAAARKWYEDLLTRPQDFTAEDRQLALSRLGDLYLWAGDREAARKAYQAGEELRGEPLTLTQRRVRVGGYVEAIETYLNAGEIEAALAQLEEWERTLPLTKLEGLPFFWRGRCYLQQEKYQRAINFLTRAIQTNRAGAYVPQAYLLRGDAHRAQGNAEAARYNYQKVVADFPESPAAQEARQRLAEME